MSEDMDKELQAIAKIIKALESLDAGGRKRAIEYIFARLDLMPDDAHAEPEPQRREVPLADLAPTAPGVPEPVEVEVSCIELPALEGEKKPRSAVMLRMPTREM